MRFREGKSVDNQFEVLLYLIVIFVVVGIFLPESFSYFLLFIMGLLLAWLFLHHFFQQTVHRGLIIEPVRDQLKIYRGQGGALAYRVRNQGFWPIMNATLNLKVGKSIEFENLLEYSDKKLSETETTFTIFPGQEVEVRLPFQAIERGVITLAESQLTIPHLMGFGKVVLESENRSVEAGLVYPDRLGTYHEEFQPHNVPGDYPINHSLYSDPMLVIGSREYQQGDQMRDIHWKLSASQGQLYAKQYQQVTRLSVMILINLRSRDSFKPARDIEQTIEQVAYITGVYTEEDIPYEVHTNARTGFRQDNFYGVDQGVGRQHYKRILELLARMNILSLTVEYSQFISYIFQHKSLPTHLIVTGELTDNDMILLQNLSNRGVKVYHLTSVGIRSLRSLS